MRSLFTRARMAKPTILFIDEIDAIVGKRDFGSGASESHVGVRERVLATLLSEMDGVESAKGVIVVVSLCLFSGRNTNVSRAAFLTRLLRIDRI